MSLNNGLETLPLGPGAVHEVTTVNWNFTDAGPGPLGPDGINKTTVFVNNTVVNGGNQGEQEDIEDDDDFVMDPPPNGLQFLPLGPGAAHEVTTDSWNFSNPPVNAGTGPLGPGGVHQVSTD